MEDEVQRHLAAVPEVAIAARGIGISAENGTLTLTGSVASENVKREVENIAEDVDGVERVQNQLIVASARPEGVAAPVR